MGFQPGKQTDLSSHIKKKYTEHFDREHEGTTADEKEEPKKTGKKERSSDGDHNWRGYELKDLPVSTYRDISP